MVHLTAVRRARLPLVVDSPGSKRSPQIKPALPIARRAVLFPPRPRNGLNSISCFCFFFTFFISFLVPTSFLQPVILLPHPSLPNHPPTTSNPPTNTSPPLLANMPPASPHHLPTYFLSPHTTHQHASTHLFEPSSSSGPASAGWTRDVLRVCWWLRVGSLAAAPLKDT